MIRYFVKSLLLTIFGGYILLSSPLLSAEDLSPEAIEATKNIASGQDNPNPAAGNIQTEQNLVEQAVIAFKNREDLDQAQKGIQLYGQLLEQNRDKILYWNR